MITDTHYNVYEPQNHVKWNKRDTKSHIYDSIYMSHPEQVNPDRERSMGHSVGLFKLK